MSWETVRVEDIAEVFDGPHATPPKSDDGPIYLGIPSILPNGGIDYENSKRISYADFPKWTKRVTPRKDDVVFSYEANLESYAIIPEGFEGCLGRRMALMRPDTTKVNPRFLFYYMNSPQWRGVIAERTVLGATVNRIPIATFPQFPIELPPLDTQNRIASVLMAYDNLIENNRRQIALLEEAAQRLYKEWFVDLRFPGHEDTETVDGVPNGWQKLPLAECVDKEIGGGWGQESSSHEYPEKGYVIRATDISGVESGTITSVPLRWHKTSNIRPRMLEAGDIIFEVSGGSREHGVGRSMLVTQEELDTFGEPVMCASFCKRIKPKRGLSLLLAECISYEYNTEGLRKFEKRSAGNIINYHWKPFLDEYNMLIPDDETLAAFMRQAMKIRDKKSSAAQTIRYAREARDRLLPKLMSGEIEV